MRVAVRGLHLEHAVADFQNRNIERAAAQVIDRDLLVLFLVEPVGERRRGRFVDDAQHFEAGNAAGVFRGLTLRVVEVGGNGDDGLRDFLAETGFGVGLELGENHRGNFGRGELLRLAVHFDFDRHVAVGRLHDLVRHAFDFFLHLIKLAAHEALDGVNRVARIGDGLTLGRVAHDALAALGESYDGRRCALALGVFQHERLATFHDGHARVRRS